MGGRPRALDDVKRREVCALVSTGCGIAAAARYVGCNAITIRREAFRNPEFNEQLRNAELSAQVEPLQALRRSARTNWRAAAWFLERSHPEAFAPRRPTTLTIEEAGFYFSQMAEVFHEEIRDPEVYRRAMARIHEIQRNFASLERALETPHRNVRDRREREAALRKVLALSQPAPKDDWSAEDEPPA